jgi:ribonuclease Y
MEYVIGAIALLVGLAVGAVVARSQARGKQVDTERVAAEKARVLLGDAERKAEELAKRAELAAKEAELKTLEREERVKARDTALQEREVQIQKREGVIERREAEIDKGFTEIRKRELAVTETEKTALQREKEIDRKTQEADRILEERAGLSREAAKKQVVDGIVDDARLEAAKMVKRIEEEAREQADRKSKRIISTAIMRYAGEYVAERTVSVVNLPSDEMKGRIIGREGRNIRAFEAATGIDLIIDDTPEAVILSGFDPVRREIARISLERLISDGRIHPTRIEEIIEKTRKEVDQQIKEAGEFAIMELGLGSMHPDVVKTLGRLKYRTSYGQNVLNHSIAVGFLTGIMMAELGLDTKLGRRAGLLHDLGKAVDHEVEGPHAVIGANLAKKYGEKPAIVHAIAAHHEDEKPNSVLACLVTAADAMSGARPGARRETLESYIRRLEDLEAISQSFDGVQKSFAIQAGRELRVMVEGGRVTDEAAVLLARDIAKQIEEKLTYPGQIKVTVIRETRAVEFAR